MSNFINLLKSIYYGVLNLCTLGKGITVQINNFPIRLPARYYKYFEADYEKESFAFFKKMCKPGMNIIDVGAHFGLYSVYMQKLSGGQVYSFEPTPSTLSILHNTIRLNGVHENIEVIPAAVSDETGKAQFFIDTIPGSVANSLVQYGNRDNQKRGYEVDVVSLDSFVGQKGISVEFMKIDAEGAEYAVLKGARDVLAKHRPVIILGMHPAAIKARNNSNEIIWSFLEQERYKVLFQGKLIDEKEFCAKDELFDVHLIPLEQFG
jgi:FkbM family methyltransferase